MASNFGHRPWYPPTRDGNNSGTTAAVPPPRAEGRANPLLDRIPPRWFPGANAGRTSSRFRAAPVLDGQIRRGSEERRRHKTRPPSSSRMGVERLQGNCNGPDGPFQRSTRRRTRARTRSSRSVSGLFHGCCSRDIPSGLGDAGARSWAPRRGRGGGGDAERGDSNVGALERGDWRPDGGTGSQTQGGAGRRREAEGAGMVRGWEARATEIGAVDAGNGRRATGIVDVGAGGHGYGDAAARGRRRGGRSLGRRGWKESTPDRVRRRGPRPWHQTKDGEGMRRMWRPSQARSGSPRVKGRTAVASSPPAER